MTTVMWRPVSLLKFGAANGIGLAHGQVLRTRAARDPILLALLAASNAASRVLIPVRQMRVFQFPAVSCQLFLKFGAANGIRTRDPKIHNLVL